MIRYWLAVIVMAGCAMAWQAGATAAEIRPGSPAPGNPSAFGQDEPAPGSYRVVSSLQSGVSGIALPLPPPEKALAREGASPPVPFGRARELLAPDEGDSPSGMDLGTMYQPSSMYDYDQYLPDDDEYGYGMGGGGSYLDWSPPISDSRQTPPGLPRILAPNPPNPPESPPSLTIQDARQEYYRSGKSQQSAGSDYGKMDSLRGSLRRDLFGSGR